MIRLFIAVLVVMTGISASAQQIFAPGVYLNHEQLKTQKPVYNIDLIVVPRVYGLSDDPKDYRLVSTIDSISTGYLRRHAYAYVKNDSVFLNCIFHKLPSGFSHVITPGNFMVFKANKPIKTRDTLAVRTPIVKESYFILSLRTGNIRLLQKGYVIERLKDYPTLLQQFEQETNQESVKTMIRYVALLNEQIPLNFNQTGSTEETSQ